METREGLIYLRGEAEPFRGEILDFYPSGKRLSLTPVKNGKVEGWSIGWFENGKVEVKEFFKAGGSDGTRTRWYPNGQIRSVAPIRHGVIEGLFQEWHENGKLQREVMMKNGKPHGRADSWTSDGTPLESFTYAEGVVVSHSKPK
jgi:antitoxin component YwqK of YwqJK toxin-antitoxin module